MLVLRISYAQSALHRRKILSSFKNRVTRARTLSSLPPSAPFNILFCGRDEFSVKVLEVLVQHHDVWKTITVATYPDETVYSRQGPQLSVSPLKTKGLEIGLEMHLVPHKKVFNDWQPPSSFMQPEPTSNNILISASFGRMIPDHVLQLFPVSRRLNVHPSLIPLYRGPAPIQHVIADGRDETGVSIIEMKEKKFGADKGDIWAIKNIDIPPRSHYADLRDSLADEGGKVLVYVLRNMINGTITASPQDNSKASHAPFITTETAKIDFHTWDAEKIERLSRAIGHQRPLTTTYPSSETLQLHAPKALVRSHTATNTGLAKPLQALQAPGEATYDPTTGYIAIRCANDTYVYVPKLKQQHKKLLEAKAWWPGVRKEWIPRRVLKLGS